MSNSVRLGKSSSFLSPLSLYLSEGWEERERESVKTAGLGWAVGRVFCNYCFLTRTGLCILVWAFSGCWGFRGAQCVTISFLIY